jgi:hypothetical protein
MGVRPHVQPLASQELARPHLVEEDEGATICRCLAGSARRTSNPPISWARGRITFPCRPASSRLGRFRRSSYLSFQLWRLELAGADVGARWQPLTNHWMPHVNDFVLVFNDLHIAMTAARVGGLAERLLSRPTPRVTQTHARITMIAAR